jgi:hypothetical protein
MDNKKVARKIVLYEGKNTAIGSTIPRSPHDQINTSAAVNGAKMLDCFVDMPNEPAVLSPETSLELRKPLLPERNEIAVLNTIERTGFWLAHRMNSGAWKRLMTAGQRHLGSLWIYLATYNLMNVFGIENVENALVNGPVLLAANHRSFFDMYTVSSVLFRRTRRPISLYFPVRGKFFYDNPLGWFVNFVMGWFSMYPPFFREARDARKREFDKYSMRRLIQLTSEGAGECHRISSRGQAKSRRRPLRLFTRTAGRRQGDLCCPPASDPGIYCRTRK